MAHYNWSDHNHYLIFINITYFISIIIISYIHIKNIVRQSWRIIIGWSSTKLLARPCEALSSISVYCSWHWRCPLTLHISILISVITGWKRYKLGRPDIWMVPWHCLLFRYIQRSELTWFETIVLHHICGIWEDDIWNFSQSESIIGLASMLNAECNEITDKILVFGTSLSFW
jgi:hypothetical protein